MAFQSVPGVYQAQVFYSDDGQEVINDLYFSRPGAASLLEASNLASSVGGWATGAVLPILSEQIAYARTVVTDLEIQFGVQAQDTTNAGSVGGISDEQAPNNCAMVMSFRTGFRGRGARGRNYVCGLPNGNIVTNTFDGTFMDAVQAAYRTLLPGGAHDPGAGMRWVIVSRFLSGALRAVGIFLDVVDAINTTPYVRSQRRRLPNIGA